MTIDEAILIGENTFSGEEVIIGKREDQAVKLAFEALKRCKYIRTHPSEPRVWRLPGETEETGCR